MARYLTFIGCFIAGMICLYLIQRTTDYLIDKLAWAIFLGAIILGTTVLFAKPKKPQSAFIDEEEAAYRSAKHDLMLQLSKHPAPAKVKIATKNGVRTAADMLDHLQKDTLEARDFVADYNNKKAAVRPQITDTSIKE